GHLLHAVNVRLRKEGVGKAKKVCGGGHVPAQDGSAAGGGELRRCTLGQAALVVIRFLKFREVRVRLLEMEDQDFLVLDAASALRVDPVAPVGEPLVQLCAPALEQTAVGRVADQDVVAREHARG